PCLLASIKQCTAPCNLRISKEEYRKDIDRLIRVLEGGKVRLLAELKGEMEHAAKELKFEQAARLRDEIRLLERLDRRGDLDTHAQPEVFYVDPKKGLAGLKKVLRLDEMPRTIDGGKGQLNAALAAFRDQEITPPTLLSLAKQEEEIFLPGESDPIKLSRHSFALRLLQYVRDEAHRFAQHYHHILRRKSQLGE